MTKTMIETAQMAVTLARLPVSDPLPLHEIVRDAEQIVRAVADAQVQAKGGRCPDAAIAQCNEVLRFYDARLRCFQTEEGEFIARGIDATLGPISLPLARKVPLQHVDEAEACLSTYRYIHDKTPSYARQHAMHQLSAADSRDVSKGYGQGDVALVHHDG